ncbi:tRNA (adenosine(37)-N6)-threonylcarbamoyltransferase complex ATPase subunit type 1 TsaE [Sphingomonas astaxanthinifaciens]|uniref:tRNA threonylcarbamoyladenosine biosynthesis protein TsaE n=1 Tax=Sphingomonas astaxanthinifaciens DSM 22298 TaxID=1123267 RepID=A0ABQ5Z2V8_9SPHN|nr:tRNA (adenosine(37)-N6)-threonylcarbamoyltransferase complex ATPase subunit type 1 TsaE [Sphingomonas astaxanthinifaciens]GLR46294.1 tRNA (adenosine(37)-N6)-threonylcarbamoyltransferase complex ATPase subunit type 1 TsaE [Sphingomonas astaxanthinifaciens DSM 22298]
MWTLTEPDMAKAGAALAAAIRAGDVVTLSGPLGAGKTTLVRGLLAALGHEGEVPSPTFAIVQPYEATRVPVAHVDLYRIEDSHEIEELGLDDMLLDSALLVEWPERADAAAWPQALRLSLSVDADGRRALTWEVPGAWEGRWPPPPLRA